MLTAVHGHVQGTSRVERPSKQGHHQPIQEAPDDAPRNLMSETGIFRSSFVLIPKCHAIVTMWGPLSQIEVPELWQNNNRILSI